MLVLGTVIKRDVTGVAKKEAASDPRFMPVGALLDVAYIDRTDTTKAEGCTATGSRQAEEWCLDSHSSGGHPFSDATSGPFQEGWIPLGDPSRCADRARGDSQRG